MTANDLLAWLQQHDARLESVGDNLRCEAPVGVLTPALAAQIREHKAELLRLLASRREEPQSFGQQRLWFLQELNPDNCAYNERAALRLRGELALAPLEQGLAEVALRHEIMRTRFPQSASGEPLQVAAAPECALLPIVELTELPPSLREDVIAMQCASDAATPFALAVTAPVRMVLFRSSTHQHTLAVLMHHIASDGWSMGLLWLELTALYRCGCRGAPSDLPDLPCQYADFARAQRSQADGVGGVQALSYWKHKLAGAPFALRLPIERRRPAVQCFDGASYDFELPASTANELKRLARTCDGSPFLACLTAFQALVYRYCGQEDFLLGVPVSGRGQSRFEALIGYFSNTLVIRADCGGGVGFRELFARTRATVLEAYEYQDTPFERIVDALQPDRSLRHSPLFQIVFTYQQGFRPAERLGDLAVELLASPSASSKFDLVLSMHEEGAEFVGRFTYCSALFDEASIARLARHFAVLTASAVATPELPLDQLRMLTPEEEALFRAPTEVAALWRSFAFA